MEPQNLEDILAVNPALYQQAQGMVGLSNQQNQEKLRQLQLQNMFDQQNNPLRLQHQQGLNDQNAAQLPGLQAQSQSAQYKAQREGATQGDAISAARAKFMKEASDADIEMLGNRAQKLAYSEDPQERAHGIKMLNMSKEMIKERELQKMRGDNALALEGSRSKSARELEQMRIDAGKYVKKGSGAAGTIEEQLKSGKLSFEKAAVLLSGAASVAEMDGDDETAQKYRAMADDYNRKHIASKQAGVQAGGELKPDLGALGIKPNAVKPVEGFSSVKKADLLGKLPQGSKDNGNGTFTLPDGRVVRPKQ